MRLSTFSCQGEAVTFFKNQISDLFDRPKKKQQQNFTAFLGLAQNKNSLNFFDRPKNKISLHRPKNKMSLQFFDRSKNKMSLHFFNRQKKPKFHFISWIVLTNKKNLLVEALSATYEAENPSFPTLASETNLTCITFSVEVENRRCNCAAVSAINVRRKL